MTAIFLRRRVGRDIIRHKRGRLLRSWLHARRANRRGALTRRLVERPHTMSSMPPIRDDLKRWQRKLKL
jgi:hypothetical protein